MAKIDTSVVIGNLHMKNPVMPASGAYDYNENNPGLFPMSDLGAIMLKTVHHDIRPGNKSPRIAETTAGMLNAVGIPSIGIHAFIEGKYLEKKYRPLGAPVIVSVSGGTPEAIRTCCEMLDDSEDIAAIELNLSCPNVGTGLQLSSDKKLLHDCVTEARKGTHHTLIAKHSPNVTNIANMVKISEDAGADAVTVANTYMGMVIDIKAKKPFLGNKQGGLSGPAIKPLTLYKVFQAYKAVSIPVIGCGGIMCAEDAIEYILAGASAVQVGAANFVDPMVMPKVIRGIEAYMEKNQFPDIASFRGLAHQM